MKSFLIFLLFILPVFSKAQKNIDSFIEKTDRISDNKIIAFKLDSIYQNKKKLHAETEILLLTKLAEVYLKIGNYKKVGETSVKGLELSSSHHYYKYYARLLNTLASFYYTEGNYKLAQINYEKAFTFLDEYGKDVDLEMKIENNLGGLLINIATTTRNYAPAIPHLERSIYLQEQSSAKNISSLINTKRLLAYAYFCNKQYPQSDSLINLVLSATRKTGDTVALIGVLWTRTEIAKGLENYDEALDIINEAISLTDTTRKNDLVDALLLKAEILKKLNRFEEEANVRSLAYQLNNELSNEINRKQINEIETKYHLNEVENRAKIEHEKYLQYFYLFIGSITSLLLFILFFYFRNIQKKNKEQQRQTRAIYEAEQKERIRIAQDLHDSIGQKLSVMKLLLPEDENNQTQKLSMLLDETTTEVRHISHNLVPEILNFGLLKAIEKTVTHINHSKEVFCIIHTDKSLKIHLSKQIEVIVFRVIQEILNNIIKHAKASEINIQITQYNDNLKITIKDNGIGFDYPKMKITEGLGWKNLNARTKLIGGKLRIYSEKGKGSQFEIMAKNQLSN